MTPIDSRRIRLASEGVVASYIHEISPRRGARARRPAPARRREHRRATARRISQPLHASNAV
jgi:hypothetical protein